MSNSVLINDCEALPLTSALELVTKGKMPKGGGNWMIENEIRPSDLYCYLYVKFGVPNGLQNLLRNDSSDNLIHWEWTLAHEKGIVDIMGLNMRTEVRVVGSWDFPNCSRQEFIDSIKKDLGNFGKKMSEFRAAVLEDWEVISNPYRQLRDSIRELHRNLDALGIAPKVEMPPMRAGPDAQQLKQHWSDMIGKYNQGVGLSMAIRAMTPVLAESFINVLIFILCRPDIKNNDRLYQNFIRCNIDVKVQSLHINCGGFKRPVDWSSEACRKYNSVINERNDMLHGNVVVEKLKFSEIFFKGKVPVFKKYESMWQRSMGVSIDAAGIDKVAPDLKAVNEFIVYVLSCIRDDLVESLKILVNRRDIGINKKTNRLAALLPESVADFWAVGGSHSTDDESTEPPPPNSADVEKQP
jgi:hypothetical protein